MIRLAGLSKAFRGRPALHDLSLEIPAGEIFGLLGHNGAGKSTTFGIMLGQVYPDAGEVFIEGISVQRSRSRALAHVGAIFEAPGFYEYLSGWRNLEILTAYSAPVTKKEMLATVEIVGLTKRIHDPVGTYSHGMRQRLALAQALLPEPRLVLLDEPTEGLDPEGIHEIRNLIQQLNRDRGLTVLFSSHLLSEVEQLCHRVAILNQGRLVFTGLWEELRRHTREYLLEVDDWVRAAAVCAQVQAKVLAPGKIELLDTADTADLVAALVQAGVRVRGLEPIRRNLESLYLELIQSTSAAA